MFKNTKSFVLVLAATLIAIQPFVPLIQKVSAAELVDQSIEVCFVTTDYEQNVIPLPAGTSISLDLFTDADLSHNKVNTYGVVNIPIVQTSGMALNSDLIGNDGVLDSYCVKKEFTDTEDHQYAYTQATIESNLDWMPVRYNDENSINFVDPDIAFPYSNEWFDEILGNEGARNIEADGHILMESSELNRRLVVVSQLDQNLPDYGVMFGDSLTAVGEYTLSNVPAGLELNSTLNLRFSVQNIGKLTWLTGLNGATNPVNVSYHWKNIDNDIYNIYEGNRALLNHDVAYTFNDSNIALTVNTPVKPGRYQLILDLVHEGVTWFSQAGADTKTLNFNVGEAVHTGPVTPQILSSYTSQEMSVAAAGTWYIVQAGRPWDLGWRCAGYDCYKGIAEEYYQCSARGIPNESYGTNEAALMGMCWWPIYNANRGLPVPASHASHPWDYLQVGWQLFIPANPWGNGGGNPIPSNNFNGGVLGATPVDPYAGMNGAYSPWPQIAFDRFIAWDGSYKTDQIKWSETTRPVAPTITGLSTDANSNTVTVYGVAIPKNHPMNIRVWNEYRDCWACGSGWDFHYQQGSAQHVKVVLFKEGWQYLGEVWNDRSDGRWAVTLPLGTNLNPGEKVFAEVQIEADYTFEWLRWWKDTYETVNFNIRNPKYFGWPYFASGGGNSVTVPKVIVDNRSATEIQIDIRAGLLGATGGGEFTNICGVPAKYYSNLRNGQAGAVLFINNRTVYSWGGTWDTFMWYGDRCERFGVPVDDPHDGGVGPQNTAGAYQDFQKGKMYWSWKHLGKFTYGIISNKYEMAGGTNSAYGWPTSEVYASGANSCQNFEGGSICDTGYDPETGVTLEDFTGIENEEVLLEPDIGGAFVDAFEIFVSEFADFLRPTSVPPFDLFEGLAKGAELYAHFLYGALRGLVTSAVDAIVFVKEVVADGKLQQVVDGITALFNDPKLLAYIIQDQIEEFIAKPFLEKVEMLGDLAVNALLIAAAGYGVAKGAVNFFTKGVTAMKEAVIAGNFGGKIAETVIGGVKVAVQFGKNGLVKVGEIAKNISSFTWNGLKSWMDEGVNLTSKAKTFLSINWWRNSLKTMSLGYDTNNLAFHYGKHAGEFLGKYATKEEYFNGAVALMRKTGENVVTVVDAVDDKIRKIDLVTGEFTIFSTDGNFVSYFVRQSNRAQYIMNQPGSIRF